MKSKDYWKLLSLVLAFLMVLFAVNTAPGQEPNPEATAEPGAVVAPVKNAGVTGLVSDTGEVITGGTGVVAQAPYAMNYQGYLTDGSGTPLNGTYNLVFSLYDAATAGTQVWGPETHNGVQVSSGLFNVVLGQFLSLSTEIFVDALFLQVTVDGTPMQARQPLRTVPYAYGLVPGANVIGGPSYSSSPPVYYALEVYNTDTTPNDRGLLARGWEYGLYAEELNGAAGNDVGIFSPDFVEALGYKSTADTYLWVPALDGIASSTNGPIVATWYYGRVGLSSSAAGIRYYYIPVGLPTMLLGQEVTVEELTVYYYTTNPASFITQTRMEKLTGAGSSDTLIQNLTNRNSTTATSYSITPTGNTRLDAASGPLTVQLELDFAGSGQTIYVGGVRLRLGHTDP